MANRWVASGASDITAPTIDNILGATSLRVVSQNVYWEIADGYWFSKAGSSLANRTGIFRAGGDLLDIWVGGQRTSLGTVTSIFGTSIIDVSILDFEINLSTGAYTLSDQSGVLTSGTAAIGTGEISGILWRIGSRGSSDTAGNTASTYLMEDGDKIGDTEVYLSGVLERTYVMPSTGTSIPDTTNSQNATLQNGTGDGSDWETVTNILAPTIDLPIYAVNLSTGFINRQFTGTYTTTATSIDYRVMRGATEVSTWAPVDSFGSGTYSFSPNVTYDKDINFEVRFNGDDTNVASSATFDVGVVIALTGSSSSQRIATQGSGAITDRLHFKSRLGNAFEEFDAETITGEALSVICNALFISTGAPVGCYQYGVGGTLLTVEWTPPSGTAYVDFETNSDNGNISVILDQCGRNDVGSSISVTPANVNAVWSGFRSFANCPIITGFSQRVQAGNLSNEFISLLQSQDQIINTLSDIYPLFRLDLEISTDNLHLTQAGSNIVGQRFAAIVADIAGFGTYRQGPEIASASKSGSSVNIVLDRSNTNYTNLSPASNLNGFRVLDDGTPVTISSSSSTANNITLNLASELVGSGSVEFAGYTSNAAGAAVNAFVNYPTVDSAVNMPLTPLLASIPVLEGALTVSAGAATSLGNAPSPSILIAGPVDISAQVVQSVSVAPSPIIDIGAGVNVVAQAGTSSANAPNPEIDIPLVINGSVAVAVSSAPRPAISVSEIVRITTFTVKYR